MTLYTCFSLEILCSLNCKFKEISAHQNKVNFTAHHLHIPEAQLF